MLNGNNGPMKVLIMGGTGAMGAHLVDLLINGGMEVAVTSRSRGGAHGRLKYILGNAHNDSFLKSVFQEKWDFIVDFMSYSTDSFAKRVNVLLDATAQYVFLSSARVYEGSTVPLTEKSPRLLDVSKDRVFLATDEYALAKARQENLLVESGRNNWTIIRPYITYSEERLQLGMLEKEDWLYRAIHGRTIVFPQDINYKSTTLTYGLDVSKGIHAILGNKNTLGEIFHITSSKTVLWKDVLVMYLDVLQHFLGFRPKLVLQDMADIHSWYPARYQILYDRMYDRKFDNQKINQFIDTSNFEDPITGLKTCLEKFLEQLNFREINWHAEGVKDRQANEYTSLSEIPTLKKKIKYLLARNACL